MFFELFDFFVFLIYKEIKNMFFAVSHIDIDHMYAYVGPRWPDGFSWHRRRGRGDDMIRADVEQMLQNIHENFFILTHKVPMVRFEDFPEAM